MKSEETIARLKFLKSVKAGHKIHTASVSVQPNDWFTPIMRWVGGENKNKTIEFIKKTTEDGFDLYRVFSQSEDAYENELAELVKVDLSNSLAGLENLKQTYVGDLKFQCDLATLQESIRTRLSCIGFQNLDEFESATDEIISPMVSRHPRTSSEDNNAASKGKETKQVSAGGRKKQKR
jgi:hypothetical protein